MKDWTLKETFPDITHVELAWMNKTLKRYLELAGKPMLPKVTAPGDRFPSNQWPYEMGKVACAYLDGHREASKGKPPVGADWSEQGAYEWNRQRALEELLETHEMALDKWGFGIPYYDGGDWTDWPQALVFGIDRPTT